MSQVASTSSASSAVYHTDQRVVLSNLTLEQKMKLFPSKQKAELENAEVVIYECSKGRYEVELQRAGTITVVFWSNSYHPNEVAIVEQFQKECEKSLEERIKQERAKPGYCDWSKCLTTDEKLKIFPRLLRLQLEETVVIANEVNFGLGSMNYEVVALTMDGRNMERNVWGSHNHQIEKVCMMINIKHACQIRMSQKAKEEKEKSCQN